MIVFTAIVASNSWGQVPGTKADQNSQHVRKIP